MEKLNTYTFKVEHIGQVSDGSHTFDELYYHRMILFSVICNTHKSKAWKSWKHHDGTMYDDYFIVGVDTPEGQYSYHYHKDHWDEFNVIELDNAPEWDGHKPEDITRLLSLVPKKVEIKRYKCTAEWFGAPLLDCDPSDCCASCDILDICDAVCSRAYNEECNLRVVKS